MVHCLCGQAAQAKQIHITIQPKLSGRDTGITGSARPWPQAHPNLLELPSSSVRRGNLSKFTIISSQNSVAETLVMQVHGCKPVQTSRGARYSPHNSSYYVCPVKSHHWYVKSHLFNFKSHLLALLPLHSKTKTICKGPRTGQSVI